MEQDFLISLGVEIKGLDEKEIRAQAENIKNILKNIFKDPNINIGSDTVEKVKNLSNMLRTMSESLNLMGGKSLIKLTETPLNLLENWTKINNILQKNHISLTTIRDDMIEISRASGDVSRNVITINKLGQMTGYLETANYIKSDARSKYHNIQNNPNEILSQYSDSNTYNLDAFGVDKGVTKEAIAQSLKENNIVLNQALNERLQNFQNYITKQRVFYDKDGEATKAYIEGQLDKYTKFNLALNLVKSQIANPDGSQSQIMVASRAEGSQATSQNQLAIQNDYLNIQKQILKLKNSILNSSSAEEQAIREKINLLQNESQILQNNYNNVINSISQEKQLELIRYSENLIASNSITQAEKSTTLQARETIKVLNDILSIRKKIITEQTKGATSKEKRQSLDVNNGLQNQLNQYGISFEQSGKAIINQNQLLKQFGNETDIITQKINQYNLALEKINNNIADTTAEAKRQTSIELTNKLLNETLALEQKRIKSTKIGTTDAYNKELDRQLAKKKEAVSKQGAFQFDSVGNLYTTVKNDEEALKRLGKTYAEVIQYINEYNNKIKSTQASQQIKNEEQALNKLSQQYNQLVQAQAKKYEYQKSQASREIIFNQNSLVESIQREITETLKINNINRDNARVKQIQADANRKLQQSIDAINASSSRSRGLFANLGTELRRTIRNVTEYGLAWRIFSVVRNAINSTITTIREFNTATVELEKVTDLSGEKLKKYSRNAFEAGAEIGRTGKEVVNAAAIFARANFTAEEAFDLSKQALVFTNVADGIDNVTEASSSLISILNGFKMEASEVTHIIDALNEVSNNFAVDTNNLTEVLKRASGTIGQTGTSYEQLIGLATGGYTTLRNAEMVATGINTISQRLRGMKEDGEQVSGLIPKVEAALQSYTGGMVSMLDKNTGELRSTYDVLQDLAQVYPKLTSQAKAYITEAVAGNVALYVQKCA